MALARLRGPLRGLGDADATLPMLPDSTIAAARSQAAGLREDGARALLLRSAVPGEARAAALAVAAASGRRPVFYEGEPPRLGPWLWLQDRLPVLAGFTGAGRATASGGDPRLRWPAAGRHRTRGQRRRPRRGHPVAPAGAAGRRARAACGVPRWAMKSPSTALAAHHRHGAGRIAELGQAARSAAARVGEAPGAAHVAQVARNGGVGADLGALAELLDDDIADEALVLAPAQRQALDSLLARCRLRDTLSATLGLAARRATGPACGRCWSAFGHRQDARCRLDCHPSGRPCTGWTWPR